MNATPTAKCKTPLRPEAFALSARALSERNTHRRGVHQARAVAATRQALPNGTLTCGEPFDEDQALAEAARYQSKINTIFVGPEQDGAGACGGASAAGGRSFLQRLAATSGGVAATCDRVMELAPAIRQLLLKGR